MFLLVCMIGLRKQASYLVGPPFLALKAFRFFGKQLLTTDFYCDSISKPPGWGNKILGFWYPYRMTLAET